MVDTLEDTMEDPKIPGDTLEDTMEEADTVEDPKIPGDTLEDTMEDTRLPGETLEGAVEDWCKKQFFYCCTLGCISHHPLVPSTPYADLPMHTTEKL